MTEQTIDTSTTALLLMDFQPRQLSRVQDEGFLARVQSARDAARAAGVQVVHVRVAFTPQDFASIPAARNKAFGGLAGGGGPLLGDPANDIVPEVAPEDGDIVVTKTRFGAFSTTNLDALLRGRGIDTLIVTGLSTSGVVLSTIRDAGDKDYKLFLVEDLCDDPKPEVHRTLVDHVLVSQAHVIKAADLTGLFAS